MNWVNKEWLGFTVCCLKSDEFVNIVCVTRVAVLCSIDHRINKTNLTHRLSSVYFVYLSVFLVGLEPNQDNRQSTKKHNTYQLVYIQGVTGGTDHTSGECSLDQTTRISI